VSGVHVDGQTITAAAGRGRGRGGGREGGGEEAGRAKGTTGAHTTSMREGRQHWRDKHVTRE
jgi:hypothetical protein